MLPAVGGDLFFALSALADVALAVGVVLVFRRFGPLWALGATVLAAGHLGRQSSSCSRRSAWTPSGSSTSSGSTWSSRCRWRAWCCCCAAGSTRSRGSSAAWPWCRPWWASTRASSSRPAWWSSGPTCACRPSGPGGEPVRVGVISDLQFSRVGAHERRAVARMREQRPDVVLLPGRPAPGAPTRSSASSCRRSGACSATLRPPGGAYFVAGDQERGGEAQAALRGTGVKLLDNDTARMRVRRPAAAPSWGSSSRPGADPGVAALRDFDRRRDPGEIGVVLAHRPDWVAFLPDRDTADLTVAGPHPRRSGPGALRRDRPPSPPRCPAEWAPAGCTSSTAGGCTSRAAWGWSGVRRPSCGSARRRRYRC